jgi:hypothetical protein
MVRVREAVGGCLLLVWGCGNDTPPSPSTAGSSAIAGGDSTSGGAASGGSAGGDSPAVGGSSGGASSTVGGGAKATSDGGSFPSGGSSVAGRSGAGGSAAPGMELALSYRACDPACPDQQYCALEEIDCSGKPCLVRAICRERPACDAQHMCSKMRQKCLCDTRGDCSPGNANWPGLCSCSENPYPCDELVLDDRPSVCECVPVPAGGTCLGANCPNNFRCEVVLGKPYCYTAAPH